MPLHAEPLPLRVAISAPLSGRAADLGREMVQAALLALDDYNSQADDLRLAVTVVDDGGRPDRGAAVAAQLCAQSDILGVVGHYDSDVTIAASSVYAAGGLAMITPIASNPLLTDRRLPGIFRWTNRDDRTAVAIAAYLRGVCQKRRAIIVESDTPYGDSMAGRFTRAFAAAGGEVVMRRRIRNARAAHARAAGSRLGVTESRRATITVERDAPALAVPPVTEPVSADIDATPAGLDALVRDLPRDFDLLFYGGAFDGAALLETMRRAGLSQLFAAGDGCWDVRNFVDPAGETATAGEGVLVLAASLAVGRMLGSVDFASRYSARYGRIGNYALNAHDTMRLLIDAIAQATRGAGRVPERAAVIEAIQRSSYQGLSYREPVRWDDKGDNLSSLTALNIVREGRFEQIAEIAAT
jgi:branched-chain amino acid transport system substrate-binding protein